MAKKTNIDENNYFYINVDEFKTEPDPIVLRKQQKEEINNAEPKSLKLAHRTRRDDFYHNMEVIKNFSKHIYNACIHTAYRAVL